VVFILCLPVVREIRGSGWAEQGGTVLAGVMVVSWDGSMLGG